MGEKEKKYSFKINKKLFTIARNLIIENQGERYTAKAFMIDLFNLLPWSKIAGSAVLKDIVSMNTINSGHTQLAFRKIFNMEYEELRQLSLIGYLSPRSLPDDYYS